VQLRTSGVCAQRRTLRCSSHPPPKINGIKYIKTSSSSSSSSISTSRHHPPHQQDTYRKRYYHNNQHRHDNRNHRQHHRNHTHPHYPPHHRRHNHRHHRCQRHPHDDCRGQNYKYHRLNHNRHHRRIIHSVDSIVINIVILVNRKLVVVIIMNVLARLGRILKPLEASLKRIRIIL
jgi:hypothetical protein